MQTEKTYRDTLNRSGISFYGDSRELALGPFGRFYRTDRAALVTEKRIEQNEIFSLDAPCGE